MCLVGLETWESPWPGTPRTSLGASVAKRNSLKALSMISINFKLKKDGPKSTILKMFLFCRKS